MPIEFSCTGCGRRIKAPDHLAGKNVRCPQCQGAIQVPAEPPAEEPAPAPSAFNFNEPEPAQDPDARRPCPMCGEPILVSAIKCRFCGEVFDAVLREATASPRLKADFDRQINGLGCLWTFLGIMVVVFILLVFTVLKGEFPLDFGPEELLIVSVIGAIWLLAGIGSFMKQVWAVYVGLVMCYVSVVGNLISLAAGEGATGGCIGLGVLIIAIFQGHKVLGMAKRLRR